MKFCIARRRGRTQHIVYGLEKQPDLRIRAFSIFNDKGER